MRIVFVHLSDVHFRINSTNHIIGKADKIVAAIQPALYDASACIIVVTGDIAFGGQVGEYKIARDFISSVIGAMKTVRDDIIVKIVVIPGNHDCDFSKPNGLRDLTISGGEQMLQALKPEDDSTVRAVVGVQDNFFTFLSQVEGEVNYLGLDMPPKLEGYERLYYEREFSINGRCIRFHCLNSAWMSTKHEQQAKILFPLQIVTPSEAGCDLKIAAFHHPALWLESNNSRDFRVKVEAMADIILTGHEHVSSEYTKTNLSGETSEYIEGALLQGDLSSESGFHCLDVDFGRQQKQFTEYSWDKNHYEEVRRGPWMPLDRSKSLRATSFQNNVKFQGVLLDPGAGFTHPVKAKLSLPDIFVYPELYHIAIDKQARGKHKRVPSKNTLEFILSTDKLLLSGPNLCGKTSLARMVYTELLKRGLVPVIVDGRSFKRANTAELTRQVEKSFEEQYDANDLTSYRQLPRERTVLMIDDLHLCRLPKRGRQALITAAERRFKRIVLLANELFPIEQMTVEDDDSNPLLSFEQADIQDLGMELRHKLISQWHLLDREFSEDEAEIDYKITQTNNLIGTLLGKNLVPARPIFILSMLQLLEAQAKHSTSQSAYAYFYEVLINQALSKARRGDIPMDMITAYVPMVAFRMFSKKKRNLSEAELEDVTDEYQEQHAVKFPREIMRQILESASVLYKGHDGYFRFNYKYIYYYFTAKYIATHLNSTGQQASLRKLISTLSGRLYVEDYANILLFLVYLTKDEKTIRAIYTQATKMFADLQPCDLDKDIKFLNDLKVKPRALRLEGGEAHENREAQYRKMDEIYDQFKGSPDSDEIEDDTLDSDPLAQMNLALKTVQILGQILRNFPGALDRKLKLQLTNETYSLALRTVTGILNLTEEHLEQFRSQLGQFIKEGFSITDERELGDRADRFIYLSMMAFSYGLIKRVALDAGSKYLEQTYKEVLDDSDGSVAVQLIDLSIKLEHFLGFPRDEVKKLNRETKSNLFGATILRELVKERFKMKYATVMLRQEVCAELDIELVNSKLLPPSKK